MATQTHVSPGFAEEVHVTGRRILAIIVDSLLCAPARSGLWKGGGFWQ